MDIQGQILKDSQRGQIISKVILEYNPKIIVEIGTWKGLGSTYIILNSISDATEFFSIESNIELYTISKKNLEQYSKKVKQIHGRIVEIDEVLEFVNSQNISEIQKSWLQNDIEDFKKTENCLKKIPNNIDLLLLDGGEFSSYVEWKILKNRTKIVLLDDIFTLKNSKVYSELKEDKSYQLITETTDGNGFAAFISKNS